MYGLYVYLLILARVSVDAIVTVHVKSMDTPTGVGSVTTWLYIYMSMDQGCYYGPGMSQ